MTETVAPVTVQTRKPVVIAPPLVGPNWLDANSCCDMGAHRMALNPLNGQLWAAERFAIDYVQLDAGRPAVHRRQDQAGELSVFRRRHPRCGRRSGRRGGRRATRAGARQNPDRSTTRAVRGNHIVQDIGDGNYALLRPPQDRQHQGEGRATSLSPGR